MRRQAKTFRYGMSRALFYPEHHEVNENRYSHKVVADDQMRNVNFVSYIK